MKIIHVVGARPNFMKVAPIISAIEKYKQTRAASIRQVLIHTGQHYDHAMSKLFFEELGIPRPDTNLEVGSGTQGQQTGRIMEAFEQVLLQEKPDLVLVVGDVNSTMACTIDAKKLGIPVAHVEAGLRSRDMTMPEEINRIVTDALSDLLFTTDKLANENLIKEGVSAEKIHFIGNVMIDTLITHRDKALRRPLPENIFSENKVDKSNYAVLTLHRPSNVDDARLLEGIGRALKEIGKTMPIVFPVHPRTRSRISMGSCKELFAETNGVFLSDPMGYLDFLNLMANARVVLTDSGGIQEETTVLGVPCLTIRDNTERPVTIDQGTNRLVGTRTADIVSGFSDALKAKDRGGSQTPDLWDGRAAQRLADILIAWLTARVATPPVIKSMKG